MIRRVPVDSEDNNGLSPLLTAVTNGHYGVVEVECATPTEVFTRGNRPSYVIVAVQNLGILYADND